MSFEDLIPEFIDTVFRKYAAKRVGQRKSLVEMGEISDEEIDQEIEDLKRKDYSVRYTLEGKNRVILMRFGMEKFYLSTEGERIKINPHALHEFLDDLRYISRVNK